MLQPIDNPNYEYTSNNNNKDNRTKEFKRQTSTKKNNNINSYRNSLLIDASDMSKNKTPDHAKLVAIDYQFNGLRARVNSGEFLPPRWVPDQEKSNCMLCNSLFDWYNRRHHCRHCGYIVCGDCSNDRCLLPYEYGESEPQRVCNICNDLLKPLQNQLTETIASHLQTNHIDTTKCATRYLNMPFSFNMASEIRKATYSTYNLFDSNWIHDRSILLQLIPQACGIAFLTVAKGGFGFAAKIGTGLVISRLSDGKWSAPTAIGTVGISWGMLAGVELTDFVVLLNTMDAVKSFAGYGNVAIGAGLEVAVGPLGRSGAAEMNFGNLATAAAFSYSHSRGLYAGLSLDGSVIVSRPDVNHNFYGRAITPYQILTGEIARPRAAQILYNALEDALSAHPYPKYS